MNTHTHNLSEAVPAAVCPRVRSRREWQRPSRGRLSQPTALSSLSSSPARAAVHTLLPLGVDTTFKPFPHSLTMEGDDEEPWPL